MNALFNHLHLKSFKCTFSISHICTIITLMPHNLEEFLVKKFLMSFTLHAQLLKINNMHAFKSKQRFLIYQYIFNCDHSYKLKTGISSHLHGKVANGPQHWGTRAECWLFSFQEADLGTFGSQVGSETVSQMLVRLNHFFGGKRTRPDSC